MKKYIICLVMSFLVVALAAIPGSKAFAASEFLYYGDSNLDGKFDTRYHFEGDLIDVLNSLYPSALDVECREKALASFTITCLNIPPCPGEEPRCLPPNNLAVMAFGTDKLVCDCEASRGGNSCSYAISDFKTNLYRLLSMDGSFLDFLHQNFNLVSQTTGAELCDDEILVGYAFDCNPDWYCDADSVCEEQGAALEWIITNLPACNCYSVEMPTLTQWGLIALLIILASIATWVVLKRRRVVTA